MNGDRAVVARIPHCDICKYHLDRERPAAYDGRTRLGPWAFMCEPHFTEHGVGLGSGRGQRLVLADD